MTAEQRRSRISVRLHETHQPISATALARELGVSRQIIVGDVALLRAAGQAITATARGYVIPDAGETGLPRQVACRHDGSEGLRQELYLVVDNGGIVEDVKVESPLYGEITGRLHVASRYDADNFVARAMEQPDGLLLRLTGGVHLHTLVCPDEETFLRIRRALAQAGILYEK